MKDISNLILVGLILIGCSSTKRNATLIEGSWRVVSLSEYPLTITNYGDGKIDSNSILSFDNDGFLKIFHSDLAQPPEAFRYEVDDDELILFYSDYGIPFHIERIASDKVELIARGFGNTVELRNKVRKIELMKRQVEAARRL